MLYDVVRRRRRWAHAPVIHAASHFDHKKRVAWVPISMHTCGSFSIIMGLRLAFGRRSSANAAEGENNFKVCYQLPYELNSEELICTRHI